MYEIHFYDHRKTQTYETASHSSLPHPMKFYLSHYIILPFCFFFFIILDLC